MKNWRKIGVGLLVSTIMSGGVLAGESYLIGPESNQIGTHTPYPGYGGSNSFGGCNKDNTFCWNITLPPTPPPSGPYYTYPIEVYGEEARNIRRAWSYYRPSF